MEVNDSVPILRPFPSKTLSWEGRGSCHQQGAHAHLQEAIPGTTRWQQGNVSWGIFPMEEPAVMQISAVPVAAFAIKGTDRISERAGKRIQLSVTHYNAKASGLQNGALQWGILPARNVLMPTLGPGYFGNLRVPPSLHCLGLLTTREKKLQPSGAEVWNISGGLQHFFSVSDETSWLYRLD